MLEGKKYIEKKEWGNIHKNTIRSYLYWGEFHVFTFFSFPNEKGLTGNSYFLITANKYILISLSHLSNKKPKKKPKNIFSAT